MICNPTGSRSAIHPQGTSKRGTLFLGELTDTFRFQEDLPNGPHEPLPMGSPQENEPPPPPDTPSAPLLLGKTNGAPAIPSLAALQIATPTPPLPLSYQPDGQWPHILNLALSFLKILVPSIPRPMTGCSVPGASNLGCLGIINLRPISPHLSS